jgi:REP element-mobilizing transposase RayT
MANTFTQIYLHIVFAVQNRVSLIKSEWKEELYKYITGIIKNNGHKLIAINGIANHLHIAVGYKPHQLIPQLLQDIKGHSSKWINEKKFVNGNSNGRLVTAHFLFHIRRWMQLSNILITRKSIIKRNHSEKNIFNFCRNIILPLMRNIF